MEPKASRVSSILSEAKLEINCGDKSIVLNTNEVAGLVFQLIGALKVIEERDGKIVDENDIELLPWREQVISEIRV